MKKLIVISMVLVMSTVASAGYVQWESWYDAGTNTATFALVGIDVVQFSLGSPSIVAPVAGTWSALETNEGFNFTIGTDNGISPAAFPAMVFNVKGLIEVGAPKVTGEIWKGRFTFADQPTICPVFEVGDSAYFMAAGSTEQIPIGDIIPYLCPEPMTMLLLGFGGLFIRCRCR